MNERIQQLAEKSGAVWVPTSVDYFGEKHPADMLTDQVDLQKFAELIVQDCIDICNKIYFDRYPDSEDWERSEEGDAIKEHFGVEE